MEKLQTDSNIFLALPGRDLSENDNMGAQSPFDSLDFRRGATTSLQVYLFRNNIISALMTFGILHVPVKLNSYYKQAR